MTSLRLLFITFFFCVAAEAQTFQWVNTVPLDIQTNPAYLHSPAAIDSSGNPVCARLVNFRELYSIAYYGDIEIIKKNPADFTVWKDTIYGKADVSEIAVGGGGSIICIGTYLDSMTVGSEILVHTGTEPANFILKLDSGGNLQWLKDGSLFVNEYGVISALSADNSGNIFIGTSDYPVVSSVITLDGDGNEVSSIDQVNAATISDITKDINGNMWVTGFAFNGPLSFNGFDTTAVFSYNEYVVKYDPSGTVLRINFIEDVTVQRFNIRTDNAGNAYLSGNLFDSTSFGGLHGNGPQWVYDFFVAKMDPEGNFIWLNEIPPGNNTADALLGNDNFLSCTGDGYTFITGIFRGQLNLGHEVILNPIDYNDMFAACYSPDGEIQWAKVAGSPDYDQGSAIISDERGNCYLTGLTGQDYIFDTSGGTGGYRNLYLARLQYAEVTAADDGPAHRNLNASDFSLMQNYPNPFNPATVINYQITNNNFVSLKVYDVLGNEVASLVNEEKPAGKYEVKFDASALASGVYFYKLTAGSFVEVRKMVLVR